MEEIVKKSENAQVPTKDRSSVIRVNCLAELWLGDEMKLRAMNFAGWSDRAGTLRLLGSLGVDTHQINYQLVTQRHAEIRLIYKVVGRTFAASPALIIDKLCCIFCAAQLRALGYEAEVVGWAAGHLSWYTFAPLCMFFRSKRPRVPGDRVEGQFSGLLPDDKLRFFKLLADLANQTIRRNPSPSVGLPAPALPPGRGTASTPPGGKRPAGDIAAPAPKRLAPNCPICGKGPMKLRMGGRFWGCPDYFDTGCRGIITI